MTVANRKSLEPNLQRAGRSPSVRLWGGGEPIDDADHLLELVVLEEPGEEDDLPRLVEDHVPGHSRVAPGEEREQIRARGFEPESLEASLKGLGENTRLYRVHIPL